MSNIKAIDIFKTTVCSHSLTLDNKALIKFCAAHVKKNKSNQLSNSGYQSFDLNKKDKTVKEIVNFLDNVVGFISKDIYKFDKKLKVGNIWFNVNKHKDYNIRHDHPSSVLSGVFYVKCPKNSGDIVFQNPKNLNWVFNAKRIKMYNAYNSTSVSLPATENMLYIFPSWLEHRVDENLSKSERISFSFNSEFDY
tara:strand:- start:61 stop:642 length:582 start_codon:yes stop_codon:yes gene_type:complete